MNKYVKIGLFGFLIWLIPFLVSFIIFPLRDSNRPLFESIMPVILTLIVVIFSILYFKKADIISIKKGFIIGFIWFIISLIIDLLLFIPSSPMQMTLVDYMMDIGFTYLIIITIPLGFSYLIESK
jgi:hypothetical protein